jgi:hypothetical protein
MSPKRIGRGDDRWDRTPGGLFVPRRPTLPTRRFVMGKWGGIKCCCGGAVACPACVGSVASANISASVSGLANGGSCTGCGDGNGTWTLAYQSCTYNTVGEDGYVAYWKNESFADLCACSGTLYIHVIQFYLWLHATHRRSVMSFGTTVAAGGTSCTLTVQNDYESTDAWDCMNVNETFGPGTWQVLFDSLDCDTSSLSVTFTSI